MADELVVAAALDELEAAESLLREGTQAQDDIDRLYQIAMASTITTMGVYRRLLFRLREMCRRNGLFPSLRTLGANIPHEVTPVSATAFSDVYRAELNGRVVALKALRVHSDDLDRVTKVFYQEAISWDMLRHPYIVPFLGVSRVYRVCLVSQWMSGGTITSYLSGQPTRDPSPLVIQSLLAVQFTHSLGLVHGDLKPENILIDEQGNARLTDFGLTTLVYTTGVFNSMTSSRGAQGTIRYMAPELLSGADSTSATVLSDIYSLAVVIWQTVPGDCKLRELVVRARVLEGCRPERPSDRENLALSSVAWRFLRLAWSAVPLDRPSLSQLLEPFSRVHVVRSTWAEAVHNGIRGPERHSTVVKMAVILPDGRCIAEVLASGKISVLYLARKGLCYRGAVFPDVEMQTLSFSADGWYLLITYWSQGLRYAQIWDAARLVPFGCRVNIGHDSVLAIVPPGPGRSIALLIKTRDAHTNVLKRFDMSTNTVDQRASFNYPTSSNNIKLVTTPDGNRALMAFPDGLVLWRIYPNPLRPADQIHHKDFPTAVDTYIYPQSVALTNECATAIIEHKGATSWRRWSLIWRFPSMRFNVVPLQAPHSIWTAPISEVMYSATRTRVAIRTASGVCVFDLLSGEQIGPFMPPKPGWDPAISTSALIGDEATHLLEMWDSGKMSLLHLLDNAPRSPETQSPVAEHSNTGVETVFKLNKPARAIELNENLLRSSPLPEDLI